MGSTAPAGESVSDRLPPDVLAAYEAGRLHTMQFCFSDSYGRLRGRRIPAERFVAAPDARQAFASGALIWDVLCEVYDTTPFATMENGYPDLVVAPDLTTARVCAWTGGEGIVLGDCLMHGQPVALHPRVLLREVLATAGIAGVGPVRMELDFSALDAGAGLRWPPGDDAELTSRIAAGLHGSRVGFCGVQAIAGGDILRVTLEAGGALEAADAAIIARAAVKEIGAALGVALTFMARTPDASAGCATTVSWPLAPDGLHELDAAGGRLHDLWLLLRPTANSFKRGAGIGAPADAGLSCHRERLYCRAASGDADPYLLLSAVIAALNETGPAAGSGAPPDIGAAASRLESAAWARRWLPELFFQNAVPLAREEHAKAFEQVAPWEAARYGESL